MSRDASELAGLEQARTTSVAWKRSGPAAALALVEQRYVLTEDVAEMIEHANRLWDLVAGSDAEGAKP